VDCFKYSKTASMPLKPEVRLSYLKIQLLPKHKYYHYYKTNRLMALGK
jgi:hypothetical protein